MGVRAYPPGKRPNELDFGPARAMTCGLDLIKGHSGAPVFAFRGDGTPYVVAVVSADSSGGKNSYAGGSRIGMRVIADSPESVINLSAKLSAKTFFLSVVPVLDRDQVELGRSTKQHACFQRRRCSRRAFAVAEISPRAEDSDVLARALKEKRVLLTEDKDFGQRVYASAASTGGVVFFRFPAGTRESLPKAAVDLVQLKGDDLVRLFAVVQPGRVRSGPPPEG